MRWSGKDLFCNCGYYFIWYNNFFNIKDKLEGDNNDNNKETNNYAKFYTKEYYQSSLYDYTSFRLNRIVSLARPKMGSTILDLGCGPGEIAVRCARLGANVFGIDVSKDALKLSAERSLNENVQIHLFEFDGRSVPFKSSTFNSIVIADVIEHIDDETLERLMIECSRLLAPDGRVIIHSSPTKNIIELSKIIKKLSYNRLDFYSRLVNPDYEFLHVRYHSQDSLRRILKRSSLHPVIWGDFQYLQDSPLSSIFNLRILRDMFSDQLWCLAFKDKEFTGFKYKDKPYLSFIDVPSEINLGKSSESFINRGFHNAEADSFRWTEKAASLFINVPEDPEKIQIELSTSNPDTSIKPVQVSLFLGKEKVSEFYLADGEFNAYSFKIPERVKKGITELKIEVDRTFVPKDCGMNDDPRELGVAVYNIKIL